MTRPLGLDVGYDLAPTALDTPITQPTSADARKVALIAVSAGRDVAERATLLDMLGLREVLS